MSLSKDRVPVADSELMHVPGAVPLGLVNPNEAIEVTVFVRSQSPAEELQTYLEREGSRRVRERKYLTPDQVDAKYGADTADILKIERFANDHGLSIVAASPRRRRVKIIGRAEKFNIAFGVKLQTYRSSRGTYRGHEGPVQIAPELKDIVHAVFGLDTKPQSTFHLRKQLAPLYAPVKPKPGGITFSATPSGYTPLEVASLYDFPSGLDGTGQTVSILEFGGGYQQSDLDAYFNSLGLAKKPDVQAVSIDGAMNAPTGNSNGPDAEVLLDIEVVGAVAPGAQIVVYFAPNNTKGWVDAIGTAVSDALHKPTVISISWGGPEVTWSKAALKVLNLEFMIAALKGITVCAAAGDNGSSDGLPIGGAHVDFPASSPFVLACGGTRLESSGNVITSETVWHVSANDATGGGVSEYFHMPKYQGNANVPHSINPPHKAGRGVPDVAGDADPNTGYRVRVDGTDFVIGGTSAVAPLWAGLLTLINQKLGKPLGYVHPLLYQQGSAAGGFNDILHGSNGAYQASPGWDPCTGLGTPKGSTLAGAI
jgi:kumamolisin